MEPKEQPFEQDVHLKMASFQVPCQLSVIITIIIISSTIIAMCCSLFCYFFVFACVCVCVCVVFFSPRGSLLNLKLRPMQKNTADNIH